MKEQFNNNIEKIKGSNLRESVLEVLEEAINVIADARNGDWTTDSRKQAIDAIQIVLYNKIKVAEDKKTSVKPEEWI